MLPNFFVIGAGKCGTTSLHRYLGLHPEIHVSAQKEPNFFCAQQHDPPIVRVGARDRYEALFESDAPARGESSGSYSKHPVHAGVPERIRELVPEARFIYLVRDPIERVLSNYVQALSSAWAERRPLREALGNVEDPRRNPYLVTSLYATQVERYREVFPAERMLVVDSFDLKTDRMATLRRIFRFLAVDEEFTSPAFGEELNLSTGKRRHSPRHVRLRGSPLGAAWRRLPERLRAPAGRRVERMVTRPAERPGPSEDLRRAMEDVFRPEVERLRELTGERFATWSL